MGVGEKIVVIHPDLIVRDINSGLLTSTEMDQYVAVYQKLTHLLQQTSPVILDELPFDLDRDRFINPPLRQFLYLLKSIDARYAAQVLLAGDHVALGGCYQEACIWGAAFMSRLAGATVTILPDHVVPIPKYQKHFSALGVEKVETHLHQLECCNTASSFFNKISKIFSQG